ncbi:uncharacterized protein [Lepeophtheirus salmonis]|uniref:uncharacterized protein n=1 Tax=Lepeophtheirus salmonis TaxID=72036 RepID=UPI001AE67F00|nr:uncharacterized protein LOC121128044 [Lepeophtheirus salmonis]
MHTQMVSVVFTLLLATHFAEGIFFPAAAVVPGAVAATGATAIATSIAPNLLGIAGAAAGAKILGLGALALANRRGGGGGGRNRRRRTRFRGRRDVDSEGEDSTVQEEIDSSPYIKIIHELEPEECMRKMICSLAASNKQDNPILFAFGNNLEKSSIDKDAFKIGFDYKIAAKFGSYVKDIRKCEIRYKCSIGTDQLLDIANL